jgi:hypothetical protein
MCGWPAMAMPVMAPPAAIETATMAASRTWWLLKKFMRGLPVLTIMPRQNRLVRNGCRFILLTYYHGRRE